jgi:hypothetical protein
MIRKDFAGKEKKNTRVFLREKEERAFFFENVTQVILA